MTTPSASSAPSTDAPRRVSGGIAADQLRSIIERIERIEEEKAGIASDAAPFSPTIATTAPAESVTDTSSSTTRDVPGSQAVRRTFLVALGHQRFILAQPLLECIWVNNNVLPGIAQIAFPLELAHVRRDHVARRANAVCQRHMRQRRHPERTVFFEHSEPLAKTEQRPCQATRGIVSREALDPFGKTHCTPYQRLHQRPAKPRPVQNKIPDLPSRPDHKPCLVQCRRLFCLRLPSEKCGFAEELLSLININYDLIAVFQKARYFDYSVIDQIQPFGRPAQAVNNLASFVMNDSRAG